MKLEAYANAATEITQLQKDKYCMISLVYVESKKSHTHRTRE